MFGVTGAGLSKFKNWTNGGKRARRSLDQWDRVRSHYEMYRKGEVVLTDLIAKYDDYAYDYGAFGSAEYATADFAT